MFLIQRIAISLGLSTLCSFPCYAEWHDLPHSINLQSVGDDMRLNGVPMKIIAVSANLPLEKAMDEVKRAWSLKPGSAPVERGKTSDWQVLNQSIGTQHRSLQLRAHTTESVEGYVALSSPAERREPKSAVRLPSDMQTVSIIDSQDGTKQAQQIVAVSPRSSDATVAALETALKAEGWQRHALRKDGGVVLFAANRGKNSSAQEFDARLVQQKAGTLIFMNTVLHTN